MSPATGLATMRDVNSRARWLVGIASTAGAFAAAGAGWDAFGDVGPVQYTLAGVTALASGVLAYAQSTRGGPSGPGHPVPRELPRGITDFTGRVGELVELEGLLRRRGRSTGPLVAAIAGKGGLGKTTLAIRAAQRAADDYPDGQLFANLRGYDLEPAEPAGILAHFLRALGTDPREIPDALHDREQLLRTLTAGRRLLIVLDNANGPRQVRPLLPGAPDVAVIVTSRTPLSTIEGAHTIVLDLLEPDEAVELLGRVAGARRVADDPAAARRLVALCGHLPLAVRIAGARLAERPDVPLADLADRLADERDRLDQLEIGDLDVRSTFRLSHQGLPEEEQRAFRMLGLFPGADFTAWALAALMDVPLRAAEHHIDALVSAQLVDATGPDETGTARYTFHDLIRALAREQSEPGAAAATQRLLGAYLTLAATAEDRFQPGEVRKAGGHPRHPADALPLDRLLHDPVSWFITEQRNIIACVRLAVAREFWDAAWELTHIGAPFFEMLATWDDWEEAVELSLGAARRSGNRWAEAITLFDTGALRRDLGRLDEALVAYEGARAGYTASGDEHGLAALLLLEGIIHRNLGDWERAAQLLGDGVVRLGAVGDRRLAAQSRRSLAVVRSGQGRHGEAIPLFQEALAEFQSLGDRRAEAYAWRNLAQAQLEYGEPAASAHSFSRSLEMTQRLRDQRGEARALQGLGRVSAAEGAAAVALRRFAQARQIAEAMHDHVLTRELDSDIASTNRS